MSVFAISVILVGVLFLLKPAKSDNVDDEIREVELHEKIIKIIFLVIIFWTAGALVQKELSS